ncbi:PREDICTED: epithelial cell-transforming sequence 2 oncogene-like isoform X2 [Myotis davidii]|uniref:epithelial cell-transforming sequence 2 oncogene-like isoform X2 n=1 Tax=Myotis davidii TaxID=225400 RepID=UPI0003EC1E89|nr:PREDICTED: epithelial cell-transforming sequence 2 oncogene-like isoform X2 [Myotis davidii]
MKVSKVDFSTVLPRFISLYIFSFLSPKDLCAAAQVSWPWKFLTEQDCIWMPKCIKLGWFLPYTPTDHEYGAWKHHYIACVCNLDWLTPREAAAVYGTLNEPKTDDEELQERHREKCLRKIIWGEIALRKKELFRARPPWVSGTRCSRLFKSRCQPRLPQTVRDRVGLHGALEKQLVLASLEALPKRSNVFGRHTYPSLSKKSWRGVLKNDDSPSHGFQTHFILISSRIPAHEMVVDSVKAGVISVVYEHSGMTLESLLYLTDKALGRQKAQSMGIFTDGDSREINLLQGYKIGIKNVLRPDVRDFWEKLGSFVAPKEEGGHVDLFVPLGASEAGIEVLSQLSQLTGTLFTAPTGIATGSYQHILSDWLGQQHERAPPSIYFSESKLQMWSSLMDFLEDTLISVRKQFRPLFKELPKNASGRIIGQFMSDTMSVTNILNNQEIAQALTDGLAALSKENPERDVLEDNPQDTKPSLGKNDPNVEVLVQLERKLQKDWATKRTRVAGELLQSERKYVQMLEILRDVYVAPLRAALSSNRAILSAANLQIIFSDILQVLSLNRQFLDNLRDRLQEWGPAHCVGEIFLKFGSQLNTYTNFFNNYPVVLKTIEKMKQNINMKDQLSDIQRIIWGCPILSEVNRYLIRVQDVAQLHCCDEEISFYLRLYEHTRDLSLFLFNDALLVASRSTSHTPFERTSKSTYQFIASVALHRLLVEDIPDSKYIKNAFILQDPKHEWICATEAEDDKFLWLSVLLNAIKSTMEK